MFKYETHLHTFPVSRCATSTVEENLAFYKKLGYDGVFITNHFLDGNINIDSQKSYSEKIEFYFSDYEKGVEIGEKLGIKVFCGVELSYKGTDFLVYGLDKEWFINHPEILNMKKTDELKFMIEQGAFVIQAHPYREAPYIDHVRLFPRSVHGVEVVNACQDENTNNLAKIYCKSYNLLEFAGSDNHFAERKKFLAGLCFEQPISSVSDFIEKVKSGKMQIFTTNNE